MANPKYHWAILVSDPSKHRHAWKAYAGGHFVQACGRKKKSAVGYPAERFAAKAQRNPDWYCSDCAKAARLALAAESAPKPDAVVWPKPRPISEAPHKQLLLVRVPGLTPEWTMGLCLFDCCWVDMCCAEAEIEPTHFLPLPPEVR